MSESPVEAPVESSPAQNKFDAQHKLVTSYAMSPALLAGLRLLFALFTLVALLFLLIYGATHENAAHAFFSYFTNLTFIGVCAYFFASGVQTAAYALSVKRGDQEPCYPLQRWPRFCQYLHVLLYTAVVTYSLVVTIVYWALLASPSTFRTNFAAFANVSKHIFNTIFALFEIFCTNVGPLPWLNLPVGIVILAGYLGVAYITHSTQGFYTYSFLDPKEVGKYLPAYIVGIAVGYAIVFVVVWGCIRLRVFLVERGRKSQSEINEKS